MIKEHQKTSPTYDSSGQVALVTGAASGMGLATASAFADSGAAVVLADLDHDAVHNAAGEITGRGRRAIGVVCDVTDERQVEAAVRRAVTEYGRLDMAFNNAMSRCRGRTASWGSCRRRGSSTPG